MLDRLKQDFGTRHIPVCVISTDDSKERAFKGGALAFVEKPVASQELLDAMLDKLREYCVRRRRKVLVALKDSAARSELLGWLEETDIEPVVVKSADKFVQALDEAQFDCVVLEDAFGKLDSSQLRQALASQAGLGPLPPVAVPHGNRRRRRQPGLVPGRPGDRYRRPRPRPLYDAALLAMHQSVGQLPEARRALLEDAVSQAKPLAGRRVLIVDDDMRNIFALATVLEEHAMDIVWADNGREAISRIANDPQIEVVLMDIMMPEMDGMDTMKEIRKLPQGKSLPMIAVTAKAMKGDREKCIEAGAWDYLSKPVDTQDLLTVLRAWLHQ